MNDLKENPLSISWHDSAWIPILNQNNVLDYFSEKSNPLYDRTCNNEIIKMQRLGSQQLMNMTGLEYILLHVQEPILYVIRKQHRHSPTQVTPVADYYVLAGYVYQAPDLNSVISSRTSAAIHNLLSAFDEVNSYMRYHSTKGYSWDFGKDGIKDQEKMGDKLKEKSKEETSSAFQRARVDVLLQELVKKFPPKVLPTPSSATPNDVKAPSSNATLDEQKPLVDVKVEPEVEVKQEKCESSATAGNANASAGSSGNSVLNRSSGGPPEKRPRIS